ncbi:macro domain-containing protein [Neobacillus drentensis]|uniref:macro domain-containing protein n=1 Tax=Neobacillus drentensis TaxID=220684 RepID=UPI0035B53E0B
MLGCFQPLHACIDNAIHSAAGPQLREDCETIMSNQKESEMTGGQRLREVIICLQNLSSTQLDPLFQKEPN